MRIEGSLGNAKLASIAASQPSRALSEQLLGHPYGKHAGWVRARTGISTLRRLDPQEDILTYAAAAARDALIQAELEAEHVDMLLVASCSTAASPGAGLAEQLLAELHLDAAYLNLNAACAGFSYALAAADSLVRTGSAQTVLIVAAEAMSSLLDDADLGTSIIFGDGAGAAVVTRADQPHIGPIVSGSDGSLAYLIAVDDQGHLRMKGQQVFRWAVELLPGLTHDACLRAGVRLADIDIFVPHQANLRITEAAVRSMDLRPDVRVVTDISESGNTSAASIPIALHNLRRSGPPITGAVALFAGFGAGLTYSAQVAVLP
jgi:3-oxoacyl-[acyl-carrier-protein] synthase-3